jgi:hypothetical protein
VFTKYETENFAKLAAKLAASAPRTLDAIEEYKDSLREAHDHLTRNLEGFNLVVEELQSLLTSTHERLENLFESKSEKWQQSPAGAALEEALSALSNFDIDTLWADEPEPYEAPHWLEGLPDDLAALPLADGDTSVEDE